MPTPEKNYWRCPDGKMHTLDVQKVADGSSTYRCRNCEFETDKRELKKNTDKKD